MLSELVRMCLISSVFKPIIVEGREIPLRSQINLLIEAPFGSGKTYLIERIRQRELGIVMDKWTENAFYGTITRAGAIIPPMTILGAGKTILIDEFQSIPIHFKQPLLKLLEEQVVNRQVLNKVYAPTKLEREFYSLWAIEGYLWFHIRASYLIVTSHLGKSHLETMLASRCIVIRFEFTPDDIYYGLAKDLVLDDIAELREQLKHYQGKFSKEEDQRYLDLVMQELLSNSIPANYAYRIRDNLIRIDNYIRAVSDYCNFKYKPEDFLPVMLAGIKGIKLRPVELDVYGKLPNVDSNELEYVEVLERKGLVRKVKGVYVRCANFGGGEL